MEGHATQGRVLFVKAGDTCWWQGSSSDQDRAENYRGETPKGRRPELGHRLDGDWTERVRRPQTTSQERGLLCSVGTGPWSST